MLQYIDAYVKRAGGEKAAEFLREWALDPGLGSNSGLLDKSDLQ